MAPSTTTPTELHRASVACLQCRKAKVRCLVSQRLDRCNRCLANDTRCVFAQPKRARDRGQPYPQPTRTAATQCRDNEQYLAGKDTRASAAALPINQPLDEPLPHFTDSQKSPTITDAVRAKITDALASFRAKRGAPFTFVSTGDSTMPQSQAQHPLSLSSILRPLGKESRAPSVEDSIKMPTYLSSMTLGHTINDPIDGGIISLVASKAFYDFFMVRMNAKWEYILDPIHDTHDHVRSRSPLLFTTILFCSSKFTNVIGGQLVAETDPFLQTRLCSLARNMVIMTLATGDRSVETMQALYCLVCWKDADDDISYLHTGYAYRILQDMDLTRGDTDERQLIRRRRIWLALFRQDRQQSLFFMRSPSINLREQDTPWPLWNSPEAWSKMSGASPLDLVACCSADLRCVQGKLLAVAQGASADLLPCLEDMLDGELRTWKAKWASWILVEHGEQANSNPSPSNPDRYHLDILVPLWEQSVRLSVASAILRQSLSAAIGHTRDTNRVPAASDTQLTLDLPALQRVLTPQLKGLTSSVEGAFGTLRELLRFHADDLRRAPDAILLLAPNAALFLCLLLCLSGSETGLLGSAFQATAVSLIHNMAQHVSNCVRSPQDSVALYSAYLDSLVDLLEVPTVPSPGAAHRGDLEAEGDMSARSLQERNEGFNLDLDNPTLQAAQVLADGIGPRNSDMPLSHGANSGAVDASHPTQAQSLVSLLDSDIFWDLPIAGDGIAMSQ